MANDITCSITAKVALLRDLAVVVPCLLAFSLYKLIVWSIRVILKFVRLERKGVQQENQNITVVDPIFIVDFLGYIHFQLSISTKI